MARKNKKAIVAMSGGVDSSVAAALLKRAGFDLIGVFMKFWAGPEFSGKRTKQSKQWNKCCSPESERAAKQVAQILGIPFYVLNLEKPFKKKVVDYFIKEYRAGRTPNPCVVCNKEIKFGLLLEKALALKAGSVATGHYARLRRGIPNSKKQDTNKLQTTNYKLLKAKDKLKDQSYFLWQLSQKQLKRILFPLGELTKPQVRILAKKFRLPVFNAPESQEICFVRNSLEEFLAEHIKEKPGPIISAKGKVLGQHNGLHFYTIGQRKGLDLAAGPWYVVKKDAATNALIVSKLAKDLKKRTMKLKSVNWISGQKPKFPLSCRVKIRYGHPAMPALVSDKNTVVFKQAQRAITPGQSAVFYKRNQVLGGGIIM